MKEKILDAFKALGFEMKEVEGIGYGFQYEGLDFLYMYAEDDEDFLNISIPAVLEVVDDTSIIIYQMMDNYNRNMKYTKAHILSDSVWLCYERDLMGAAEDISDLITKMILHLESGYVAFNKVIEMMEKDMEEDSETSEDADTEITQETN
ncbi:MAG: hypothetical protein J6I54_00535 [Bacteroidaceae bacterium]|nr:hypothetical protein [Bacteroidaceae bacterium]